MSRGRILVVCTANICRSPMAEALLAAYLVRHAPDADVDVGSAGTHAREGDRAARGMRAVAHEWGVEHLDLHRARRVDADLVARHDLVLTMEDRHRTAVARLAPTVGQRTFNLTELTEIVEAGAAPAPAGAPFVEHVRAWHAARARLTLQAADVADPYGGPDEGYLATGWELVRLVERLGPALARALGGR